MTADAALIKRAGSRFTLVELWVVCMMGLISFSMLFPLVKKGGDAGIRQVCQDNLKKQGMAFAQYASDYDGCHPVKFHLNRKRRRTLSMGDVCVLLNPYLGIAEPAREMYFNPFNPGNYPVGPSSPFNGSKVFYCPGRRNTMNAARYSDYGSYFRLWTCNVFDLRFSRVKNPGRTLLRFGVRNQSWGHTYGAVAVGGKHQIYFGHGNRCSALYFDGHASFFSRRRSIDRKDWKEVFKVEMLSSAP